MVDFVNNKEESATDSRNYLATLAFFHNFRCDSLIRDQVVIFWESHTNNPTDRERIRSTMDLVPKMFDMVTCEKYEVRTGFLSRYNYLEKPLADSSVYELEEAVIKGEEEQSGWIERCSPKLPAFSQINWQECVSSRKNPYFAECHRILKEKVANDERFAKAYKESSEAYAVKRHTNLKNGLDYLIEENSWIMSLPHLHPGKHIYIIHVGNVTDSTMILFSEFEYLRKSAQLMFPSFTHKEFASMSDFKMEYEAKKNFGYYLNNFNSKERHVTKADLQQKILEEQAEKELLASIISELPGHIYWMNSKYNYVGCNKLQAKHLGLSSPDEIIGKTVFDFLSPKDAAKHNNINKLVIERGKSYSGEEKVSIDGEIRTYLSTKAPLLNHSGVRVGLLGVSVDVTDRKSAEKLREQNKQRMYELEKQKEAQAIAESVAHDIRSPLLILSFISQRNSLPEKEDSILKSVIASMDRILSELLSKYNLSSDNDGEFEREKYVCVQTALREVMRLARYQYSDSGVVFEYLEDNSRVFDNEDQGGDQKSSFSFLEGDYSDFCRMMFNLINNAVEATETSNGEESNGKARLIRVGMRTVTGTDQKRRVTIFVSDNGSGMPKGVVDRIVNEVDVSTTKEHGHGLGLKQVVDTVRKMNGKLEVKSEEGVGTCFELSFDVCNTPKWFCDRIDLKKGDTLVIIDDDSAIFSVWADCLKDIAENIEIKYFTDGKEGMDFLIGRGNGESVFLIADYDLKGQEMTGMDIIQNTKMEKRSLLVTGTHISLVKNFKKQNDDLRVFTKNEGIEKIKVTLEA